MTTKLIVGLGNPGKQYEHTRHNAGFDVIDILANKLNFNFDENKFKATFHILNNNGNKVIFFKPLTYMNLSGEAVRQVVDYYHIDINNIIVIHDDLDLEVGKIRLRMKGSSGGQKGMQNIIDLLHSQEIKRIRIGIGKNKLIDTKDYVLSKIKDENYSIALMKVSEAVIDALSMEFDKVMNKYNK